MKAILPGISRIHTPEQAYASRYAITATATLATVLEILDTTIVSVAVPNMMGSLGATLDEVAWVTTGYAIANVIVLPISSWLADRFGRRNYFALSILLFTLASVLCGTASSVQELVFWRIVQGLAGGGLIPSSQLVILQIFPATEVGLGMGIWGSGMTVAPALGPILGGWITDHFSWPWIFYINLPLGILTLFMALRYMPDSSRETKPVRVDFVGLLLLAVSVGCAQALIERGERQSWFESPEILAYALLIAAAIPLFIWHEKRTDHPIIDLGVFANRQFVSCLPVGAIIGAVTYMATLALPVYLQTLRGYTAYEAGLAQLPFAVTLTVCFAIVGKLTTLPRLDLRYMVFAGLLIVSASMVMNAGLTLQSGENDFIAMQVWRSIGVAMAMLPMSSLSVSRLPAHQLGVGNSLFNLFRMFGGSLGVAAFTSLLEQRTHVNRGEMVAQVHMLSGQTAERMEQLRQMFLANGDAPAVAAARALHVLNDIVTQQAMMNAYNQIFMLFACAVLVTLLTVPMMVSGRISPGSAPSH